MLIKMQGSSLEDCSGPEIHESGTSLGVVQEKVRKCSKN